MPETTTLDNFTSGLNVTDDPGQIQPSEAREQLNLLCRGKGRLVLRPGQHPILPSQAGPVQGFARFQNATVERLVFAMGGTLYAYDEYFGITTTISLLGQLHATNRVELVPVYNRLFLVDGSNVLRQWTGAGNLRAAGIVPPGTAPTVAVGAAGALTGTFQYYVAFRNADGIRSNPSPISAALVLTAQRGSLSAIPLSTDAQVTARDIYRTGGGVTVPRFIGSLNDNTTTVYTDNQDPTTQSTVNMLSNYNPAPTGATLGYMHKNRLWLAGWTNEPYALQGSTLGAPEYFPLTVSVAALDGVKYEVPARFDNRIVGISGTGSIMVIGCLKSLHVLFGNDSRDFRLQQVSSVGVASHRSMVRCNNTCVFLGTDGRVYAVTEGKPLPVSGPIDEALRAIPGIYYQSACAAYVGNRYVLVVPRGPGEIPGAWAFDFEEGREGWTDLSDKLMAVTQLQGDESKGQGELLAATAAGYLDPAAATYNGIISTLSATDKTTYGFKYRTASFNFGLPRRLKRLTSLLIEGWYTGSTPLTVTVSCIHYSRGGGTTLKQRQFRTKRTSGALIDTTLPVTCTGHEIYITIEGSASEGEINQIVLQWTPD